MPEVVATNVFDNSDDQRPPHDAFKYMRISHLHLGKPETNGTPWVTTLANVHDVMMLSDFITLIYSAVQ